MVEIKAINRLGKEVVRAFNIEDVSGYGEDNDTILYDSVGNPVKTIKTYFIKFYEGCGWNDIHCDQTNFDLFKVELSKLNNSK